MDVYAKCEVFSISYKAPFNGKARGNKPKSHMYLISLNFRVFFLWSLAVLILAVRYFLDVLQNYMAFWPLTSSFSVERDFNSVL